VEVIVKAVAFISLAKRTHDSAFSNGVAVAFNF